MSMTKRIQVPVTEEEAAKYHARAAAKGISLAEYVRQLLQQDEVTDERRARALEGLFSLRSPLPATFEELKREYAGGKYKDMPGLP